MSVMEMHSDITMPAILCYRAGVQYSWRGKQTVTFSRDVFEGEPICDGHITELNGKPVRAGDPVPEWVIWGPVEPVSDK